MSGWRVFYDGGRMFDSDSASWEALPDDGLQVVVVYLEQGERILSGHDYYFKAEGGIGGNSDSEASILFKFFNT